MKLKNYIYGIALGAVSLTFASCYNADREFPDYEGGTTAYFAYQCYGPIPKSELLKWSNLKQNKGWK